MKKAGLALVLFAGFSAGCAGTRGGNTGTLPGGIGSTQTASSTERQVAKSADGSQAGRIVSVSGNQLVLQPYESSAGTAYLALPDAAPVFSEGRQTSMKPTEALKAGEDVNVYFTRKPNQPPTVLGVRVLSPEEASQVQQQLSQAGKGSAPSGPSASSSEEPSKQFSSADGSQAGEIAEISQDVIVIDPYERGAGQAALSFDKNAKVLRNGETVAISTLSPGDDVRVFYKNQKNDKPKIIGVEVLSPAQKAEHKAEKKLEGRSRK